MLEVRYINNPTEPGVQQMWWVISLLVLIALVANVALDDYYPRVHRNTRTISYQQTGRGGDIMTTPDKKDVLTPPKKLWDTVKITLIWMITITFVCTFVLATGVFIVEIVQTYGLTRSSVGVIIFTMSAYTVFAKETVLWAYFKADRVTSRIAKRGNVEETPSTPPDN